MDASANPQQRARQVLTWTRVMDGEYIGTSPEGTAYYVDFISSGCPTCTHHHEGWQLTYRERSRHYEHQFPSMRTAKAAAEIHARVISGGA